ncbi:Exportin-5 [Papilio machaon]|uniref:Exportin-5 n=1 Tax=Papilio machaon TaxID=76193 RepID=A0A194RCW0_PAPMA|nr:Exportin-5 [Papilio machaon]
MNVEAVNGDMAGEVGLIADELSRAVELTLNAAVSHDARNQAYNACESFKENSPWCAQAGLLLASGSQYSAVVKHFGLQLMEHTVKYRWTQITQAEKIFIKENAMKLLYMGGWETGHLNDALARVIVEMIKREWPQQWPTLLAELSDACSHGHLHTQIVLHVFLRLVEDVATLQTLEQHQRRKDIYQALTSNMAEIFAFFMRLIELHVQEFREKTAAGDYAAAASNGRVVQVVLLTLTGFVEWVSTNHVVMNDGRLLQILCILLQDEVFRLPAAECLLQVVNRKGSTKERKPLMILFSEDAISSIHRAALASIGTADEKQYLFLKKLSQVLDVVLSRLLQAEPRPCAAAGLRLLRRCVEAQPRSPLLLSLLLSLISALFVFLSCAYSQLAGPGVGEAGAELLPRVLDKIFAALVYEGEPPEDRRSRSVKNVRRHAAGLLVKLGSKYPLLLLPVFGRLNEMCSAALARPDLSAVESVTIQEALLLVSNHFCCYERQTALVAQVLGDCSSRWAALAPHVSSAEALARLVGLDAPPADDEERGRARSTLLHALTLLLGVVKRTHVPADPDKASRGGFGAGVTSSGNPVWRNPCSAHVLPLLPHALALARALHELHEPRAATLRHPAHRRALLPPPAERHNLLGLRDDAPPAPTEPQDRMQNYLHTLHDNVCHLVGAAAASLGRELYGAAGLARFVVGALLHAPACLPDHWLRRVLRAALRPLLLHCPPAHYADVALPLLEHLAPFMLVHLSQRWEYVTSLYESGKLEEEGGSESQEVLEDMLVRHLTREHLELLKISLVDTAGGGGGGGETGDMEEESAAPQRAPEHVSELGALVLAVPVLGPTVLHTILRALTWNDSTSSLRACALALPALRAALAAGRVGAADASGALAAVLQALRTHGQHDANQAALLALAVQSYEMLRPRFPGVVSVLRAIPDVDAHDLQRLDDKLAAHHTKPPKIDKSKRDLFKKITSRLIGRNVGQLFKKEVFILDLPTMHVAKEKARSALDATEGAGLESLFAPRAPT